MFPKKTATVTFIADFLEYGIAKAKQT